MKALPYLLLLVVAVLQISVHGEFFTAVVDLERLVYTEGEIVRTLEKYLANEEQRLQKVRWFTEEYDKLYRKANEDIQMFLSNPINAYVLVKHLTADWKTTENLIQGYDSRALIENITQNRSDLQFPDDEDLNGAAIALMRLQDTYNLNTTSLALGVIEGTIRAMELSAGDCFELGKQAFNGNDFNHSLMWVKEALYRLDQEEDKTADKAQILEYIVSSSYKLDDIQQAVKYSGKLIEVSPDHPNVTENLQYYQTVLKENKSIMKRADDGDEKEVQEIHDQDDYVDSEIEASYFKLCRGEKFMSEADQAKLHCRLFTNNHPYLLIQPVKEEELNLKPKILVYHNFLSEREIDLIKRLSQPKLETSGVQAQSGETEFASYRISKSAWLKDKEHSVVAKISNRINYVTGLSVKTAEALQVANYGIGGHYETHLDYAQENEVGAYKHLGTGNRIATWLNYMSDVEAGGATVFPLIGVGVKPEKGSAAFWFNLFKSGKGDNMTAHAACPVLAGSKWIANKWLHEHDQEFVRRCSFDPME